MADETTTDTSADSTARLAGEMLRIYDKSYTKRAEHQCLRTEDRPTNDQIIAVVDGLLDSDDPARVAIGITAGKAMAELYAKHTYEQVFGPGSFGNLGRRPPALRGW